MTYPYSLSLASVRALKPCNSAIERLTRILPKRGKIDAAKARVLGCTYDDIIWSASADAMGDESLAKRLTGYLNDNAKRMLHIFEDAVPDDDRVRKCVEATDNWLAGLITEEEWQVAAMAARAARDAWDAWAARAAWDARAARAAWDAEFRAWQFDRLIYWLCEESPAGLPMPDLGEAA